MSKGLVIELTQTRLMASMDYRILHTATITEEAWSRTGSRRLGLLQEMCFTGGKKS